MTLCYLEKPAAATRSAGSLHDEVAALVRQGWRAEPTRLASRIYEAGEPNLRSWRAEPIRPASRTYKAGKPNPADDPNAHGHDLAGHAITAAVLGRNVIFEKLGVAFTSIVTFGKDPVVSRSFTLMLPAFGYEPA